MDDDPDQQCNQGRTGNLVMKYVVAKFIEL